MGLLDRLGFTSQCTSCGSANHICKCSFCNQIVCNSCLAMLVQRDTWPEWFIGRHVQSFDEFSKLAGEYKKKIEEHGGNAHLCTEFLKFRWTAIEKYFDAMLKRFGKKDASYEFRNK